MLNVICKHWAHLLLRKCLCVHPTLQWGQSFPHCSPTRAQFHSEILEKLIMQHHTVFPSFLFTSTRCTAVAGSKAGIAERLFNKTTMLNLHFTLKDPSGVLTKLSHNHFMTVCTQAWDGGALKHPQKPFASTEVGVWSSTQSLKLSSTHGLFLC